MDRNATLPGGDSQASYIFALWNLVIRPPRSTYNPTQLGPTEFEVHGIRASRRDVRLRTQRGSWLECSHFVPRQERRSALQRWPVVIYLHGNASSRLEACALVSQLIAQRISLFCFDAAGCGLSEGDYISLGWYERDDLAAVIAHLRQSPFCGPIGIWGRSMGAVTALLHADRDPSLGAICLDSPFASLRQLAEELARSDRVLFPVPAWLVGAVLSVIRIRVKTLAGFDINDLVPVHHASRSYIPALFMHAQGDTFVKPQHSQQIYDLYGGDKQFITINGDHNSLRGPEIIGHAVNFFCHSFRLDEIDLTLPSQNLINRFSVAQEPEGLRRSRYVARKNSGSDSEGGSYTLRARSSEDEKTAVGEGGSFTARDDASEVAKAAVGGGGSPTARAHAAGVAKAAVGGG